jgi:hypothetical protein
MLLRSYFRSGWAFFIPYLAAYLLYAWLKWPVNPTQAGAGGMEQGARGWVPCLLHVYWALHALHLVLGAIALRSWWKGSGETTVAGATDDGNKTSYRAVLSQQSTVPMCGNYPPSGMDRLWPVMPWICLALLFYIPGLYLEWPSDSWEHLRRINEWHTLDEVTAHSAWKKSSYIVPYSLTGNMAGLLQLGWLNVYYTAVCLLLSWHYYRLARTVGLRERASLIFVLLNAITFGNNIFSFYRYYGLASSIFAQFGAVALTRIVLEALGTGSPESNAHIPLASRYSLLRAIGAGLLLLLLIAFNHVQGLAIAGLGVLAAGVWRLLQWKRSSVVLLTGAMVILNIAAVMWLPRHSAIDEAYRPQGWLTNWYGFDLFSPESPALVRAQVIFGAFGAINLILGLWLVVRKNHVVGWLTLTPVIALALPCFALPLAHVMAAQAGEIATFHRFLFAVPAGLAFVVVFSSWRPDSVEDRELATRYYSLLCTGLVGAVALSAGTPSFNRLWHALQITPDDMQLRSYAAAWTPANLKLAKEESTLVIASPIGATVKEAFQPGPFSPRFRSANVPFFISELDRSLAILGVLDNTDWGEPIAGDRDWQLFTNSRSFTSALGPVANLTAQNTRFLELDGQPANQIFSGGRLTISNPPGATSSVFSAELIPVDRAKHYLLSSSLRQSGNSSGINYLAVAWYDANRRYLPSNHARPVGAGEPTGWSNGSFSYYGVVEKPAPLEWTSFTVSFGLGEVAAIPFDAAFVRVGALLNHNASRTAVTELTNVVLSEKRPYKYLLLVLPATRPIFGASQAALLSRHWNPQRVANELAVGEDLRAAGEITLDSNAEPHGFLQRHPSR